MAFDFPVCHSVKQVKINEQLHSHLLFDPELTPETVQVHGEYYTIYRCEGWAGSYYPTDVSELIGEPISNRVYIGTSYTIPHTHAYTAVKIGGPDYVELFYYQFATEYGTISGITTWTLDHGGDIQGIIGNSHVLEGGLHDMPHPALTYIRELGGPYLMRSGWWDY